MKIVEMEQLSELARVYLKEIDVINEARAQLEQELDAWWKRGLGPRLLDELKKMDPETRDVENQSSQKDIWYTLDKKSEIRVRIHDPRRSGRSVYRIVLEMTSLDILKRLRSKTDLTDEFRGLWETHLSGNGNEIDFTSVELLGHDVQIIEQSPEDVAKHVVETAKKYFEFVVAYYKFFEKKSQSPSDGQ